MPRTWIVLADNSESAQLIQSAIDGAADADTVLVQPGTYHGNIVFQGRDIVVRSAAGSASTIIDGDGQDQSVVRIDRGESNACVLDGFTLTDGNLGQRGNDPTDAHDNGGGLHIRGASPIVRHCIIRNNFSAWGGGVGARDGNGYQDILIEECRIEQNKAHGGGGGVFLGTAILSRCEILGNESGFDGEADGGGVFVFGGAPQILDCVIMRNISGDHGGGLAIWNNSSRSGMARIVGCLIARNQAIRTPPFGNAGGGGGIHFAGYGGELRNCTICFNEGGNETNRAGGGLSIEHSSFGLRILDNIIAFNGDGGLARWGTENDIRIEGNLFWSNPPCNFLAGPPTNEIGDPVCDTTGTSNQTLRDPLFCDPAHDDFRVAQGSPALANGHVIGSFSTPGCSSNPSPRQ